MDEQQREHSPVTGAPGSGAPRAVSPERPAGASRRLGWPPPWETLAVTTTLMAVSVAVGPRVGVVPVAVLSLLWFLAVAFVMVTLLVRGRHTWSASRWVFVIGVGAATLRMTALGIVQLVGGRSALFWNVDWRYHATQAYGIARFGGVTDSLDYAGRPVEYHAGPAWIAGSLHGTLGLPVNLVLFVLVPLASGLVIGASAYRLLRFLGAGPRPALLSVAVALSLATDPIRLAQDLLRGHLADAFLNAEAWSLTPSLMLNSLLALAVGFTGAWMIVGARSTARAALGGVCLATVVALKPQYFTGIAAALGIGYLVVSRQQADRRSWRHLLAVAGATVGAALVFVASTSQSTKFTGFGFGAFGVTLGKYVHSRNLLGLVAATIVVLAAVPVARRSQSRRFVTYAIGAVVGVVLLAVFLDSTAFLLDATQVERAQAVGLDYVRSSFQGDLQQALVAATLLLAMIALVQVFGLFPTSSGSLRHAPVVIACLLIALTVPFVVSALTSPTGRAAYEWTEEKDARALFDRVHVEQGVWLSSDLADSAQDFERPLRAVNLTSLAAAQFPVANVGYGGWTQDDVVQRVKDQQRFFETAWSPWHDRYLRRAGVRFVLVRNRCPAFWDQTEFPGRVVGSQGDWTLLEADGKRAGSGSGDRLWPEFTGEPVVGLSECLGGGLRS